MRLKSCWVCFSSVLFEGFALLLQITSALDLGWTLCFHLPLVKILNRLCSKNSVNGNDHLQPTLWWQNELWANTTGCYLITLDSGAVDSVSHAEPTGRQECSAVAQLHGFFGFLWESPFKASNERSQRDQTHQKAEPKDQKEHKPSVNTAYEDTTRLTAAPVKTSIFFWNLL